MIQEECFQFQSVFRNLIPHFTFVNNQPMEFEIRTKAVCLMRVLLFAVAIISVLIIVLFSWKVVYGFFAILIGVITTGAIVFFVKQGQLDKEHLVARVTSDGIEIVWSSKNIKLDEILDLKIVSSMGKPSDQTLGSALVICTDENEQTVLACSNVRNTINKLKTELEGNLASIRDNKS